MSVLVRATSHPNNEINVVFCASKHKSNYKNIGVLQI